MWSYKKVPDGFQIIYDKDELKDDEILTGFNVFFPEKHYPDYTDINWNEEEINKMVTGLNNGTIKINMDEIKKGNIHFHFNFPKDYEFNTKEE